MILIFFPVLERNEDRVTYTAKKRELFTHRSEPQQPRLPALTGPVLLCSRIGRKLLEENNTDDE